ncbi:translation initiation factor 2 [Sporosarcina sp. P21c]|uniref:hypothetical protein n=1 Tax=Sporosarcina TaxID=1569 RepID=UPI000A14CDA4|nr:MULTISPECIES: hypothetical protein [Sporosarcina]ARJ37606.1 hypothetical protein SporoP8_01135 [Sporosarcina ureae]PIC67187.1 translation initiation factor 2 [Sporosarcina sp. P16a]PIC82692.1 translation initiation factor 2 [Sporosarcina sp. P1]PIC89519.1 translation initiation factor 2 [Sporosarcina sp. P21c]PIC92639.1 translation initiation factor 2 [Sporosarcina sp. P25]
MYNSNKQQFGKNTDSPEVFAAKLALLGAAISTLGDGIQTIAAGIALQELENSNRQDPQDQLSEEMKKMQKQIDQLSKQIAKMDKSS